jgi:hypothetical protein
MMKSWQTVAQQSHRRGIAFGARPHRAKRSLSLLAKVKQTTRRFRLIFQVGATDPFLQIEIKKERHSTRSRASPVLHAVVVIPMAAPPGMPHPPGHATGCFSVRDRLGTIRARAIARERRRAFPDKECSDATYAEAINVSVRYRPDPTAHRQHQRRRCGSWDRISLEVGDCST